MGDGSRFSILPVENIEKLACFVMAKRKCKSCGRTFDSKGTGDLFCSPLCKATGFFVSGGGDTSKPGAANHPERAPVAKVVRIRKDDAKFEHVRKMFTIPPENRWAIAKDFTDEERAYAKRLERRRLMEEDRIFSEWDWGTDQEEVEDVCGIIGDSDDGSI